jgi:hypothetical protein
MFKYRYLNFEGIDKKIVQSDKGESILNLETVHESSHEVRRLLQVLNVDGLLAGSNLHVSCLQVKSNLK